MFETKEGSIDDTRRSQTLPHSIIFVVAFLRVIFFDDVCFYLQMYANFAYVISMSYTTYVNRTTFHKK
jgi:hypothetical protein